MLAIKKPVTHHPIKLSLPPKQDGYQFDQREDDIIFVKNLIPEKATFVLDFSTDTMIPRAHWIEARRFTSWKMRWID